jgi:tetratricopeptide (TPR) repeat protein
LTEQYALALLDIDAGRYSMAQQRLEFIIQNNPSFADAPQKLAEVMVKAAAQQALPTATLPPTMTLTPDLSGVEEIYQRALQASNSLDWPNALANLDTLRRKDPTYRTSEVDGMYYFALRNYGYDLIVKQGNLEGGIYQLTLAERFGPLDSNSYGLREGARLYVLGASFWDLDWKNAIFYFSQLYAGFPQLWDGTMTASERYRIASIRYGDELLASDQWCAAYEQYQNAQTLGNLDDASAKNAYQAMMKCNPPVFPTETPPSP